MGAVLLLLALPIEHTAGAMTDLARSGFALNAESRGRFQALVDPGNFAVADTRFLHQPGALAGGIYVAGDPRYYLAADRGQAAVINGWALELLLPAQWRQLQRDLEKKRPAYIFVSRFYRTLLPNRSPRTMSVILARYRLVRAGEHGDWYEFRKDPERSSADSSTT